MTSYLKKRKSDQEDGDLLLDSKPHQPISYVRKDDDDDDNSDSEEELRSVLESMTKEEMVSVLLSASLTHPPTLAAIRRSADADPSRRKIFVHGLGWDTTADSLRRHFSPFGDLDDVRVVTDKATGKSKGYGFILFRHRKSAKKALKQPQKLIDNRMTSSQLASLGPPTSNPNNPNPTHAPNPTHPDNSARKIYVANVHSDIDGKRLLEFFRQYGEIEEGPIGFDRVTGKPKGFALFVYRTVEGAQRAVEESPKNFDGHLLLCNRASDGKGRAGPTAVSSMGPGMNMPAATPVVNAGTNPNPTPNTVPNMNMGGGFGGLSYPPGAMITPELAAAAAMMGQGFLGGMQNPNAAALMAMLTAASQNPTLFNPAVLASLNPAMMATFGQPMAPASGVQSAGAAASVQGQQYGGMGSASATGGGYGQSMGYQGPPGFQGQPGFQNAGSNSGGGTPGGNGGYHGGVHMGQGASMARPSMGGFGPH